MTPPAGLTLHFADSEFARIEPAPGGCTVVLAAALVRGPRGDGWVRGLRLHLSGEPPGEAERQALLPGRLHAGELRHGGGVYRQLPLPCELLGSLALVLHGPHHTELVLRAQGLTIEQPPEALVHDTLAC